MNRAAPPEEAFRDGELLADVDLPADRRRAPHRGRRCLADSGDRGVAGAERGGGRPYVSLLGSRKHTFFTDGARELFDCAGQGRIDVFFLSGGQIDGEGNINLVSVGDYDHPKARFPGSFGSAYLYYVVPKVILFRVEHSRRTLVPKVDFVSAPGGSADNVYRPGGPVALVTNRCLFDFDRDRRRFRLASVHPGTQRRRSARQYRLRFRPAGAGADHARAVGRDAASDALRGGAASGRGLSAIRSEGIWDCHAPRRRGIQYSQS